MPCMTDGARPSGPSGDGGGSTTNVRVGGVLATGKGPNANTRSREATRAASLADRQRRAEERQAAEQATLADAAAALESALRDLRTLLPGKEPAPIDMAAEALANAVTEAEGKHDEALLALEGEQERLQMAKAARQAARSAEEILAAGQAVTEAPSRLAAARLVAKDAEIALIEAKVSALTAKDCGEIARVHKRTTELHRAIKLVADRIGLLANRGNHLQALRRDLTTLVGRLRQDRALLANELGSHFNGQAVRSVWQDKP